jgi:hypothetical protein
MSASFWKLFGIGVVSTIDNLLGKEDVTMEQLFAEDELLNECKYGNKTLLAFVLRPSSLESLFQFLVTPVAEAADPKVQRYPHIAAEVLCTEGFWEHLSIPLFEDNPHLITHLWGYFQAEGTHPTNLSAVSRVASTFFERLPLKSFELLPTPREAIIDGLLNLCDHDSVVELLLKIDIASQTPENAPIQEWLETSPILSKLLKKLDSSSTPLLVCETISDSLQEQLNRPELVARLQHPENFALLLSMLFNPESTLPALLPVMSLLITLLKHDSANDYDSEAAPPPDSYLEHLLAGVDRIKDLLTQVNAATLFMSHDTTITRVGGSKLKIIELIFTLVILRKKFIIVRLVDSGILAICFELFFAQPWNNFLHKYVADMLLAIIHNGDNELLISLLNSSNFLERIGTAARLDEESQNAPKHIQHGYMGHIALIVEALLSVAKSHPPLLELMAQTPSFVSYLNRTLYPTQKRQFCWYTLSGLPEKYILFPSEFVTSIPQSLLNADILVEPVLQFAEDSHDDVHDYHDDYIHSQDPIHDGGPDYNSSSGDEDYHNEGNSDDDVEDSHHENTYLEHHDDPEEHSAPPADATLAEIPVEDDAATPTA